MARKKSFKSSPEWKAYREHAYNAKQAGIPFKLTFYDWLSIWLNSGKFYLRGNRGGRYCMCRFGDKGAYEVGNVRIDTINNNTKEKMNDPKFNKQQAKRLKNLWQTRDYQARRAKEIKEYWADSKRNTQHRKLRRVVGRRVMTNLWADPKFRAKVAAAVAASNKRRASRAAK